MVSNPSVVPVPGIVGPVTFSRQQPNVPVFRIELGAVRFFAVELATDPNLLDPSNANRRTADNYFASWDTGLNGPADTTTYPIPPDAWLSLRKSDALFYRVLSSTTAQSWTDVAASTPIAELRNTPRIQLTDDPPERAPRDAPLWVR